MSQERMKIVSHPRSPSYFLSLLGAQVALFAAGCGNEPVPDNGDPQTPSSPRGQPVADLRTMQAELAHVRGIAQSVSKNEQGYWEATFTHGIVMIYVPAGEFTMGNDELNESVTDTPSSPAHPVTLTHYWIAKTPVTRGQFRAFVSDTGYSTSVERAGAEGCYVYDFGERGFVPTAGFNWRNAFDRVTETHPRVVITDEHPVNCVSWDDANMFSKWFARQTGLAFRLPTEAQWEFAARGSDGRPYPWGSQDPDGTRANYAEDAFNEVFPMTEQSQVHHGVNDGYAATSPVGAFPAGASPIGALDMAGNVTEWVFDYMAPYEATAATNPLGPERGDARAMKAGFWAGSAGRFGQSEDEIRFGHNIRADARQGDDPMSADDHLGFRLAIGYVVR